LDLGADLFEYTLMVAFVALASAAIFLGSGSSPNDAQAAPAPDTAVTVVAGS
jgi:hypothetical protein